MIVIGYFVKRTGRSDGPRPFGEGFLTILADMGPFALRTTDCVWLVPTWVPPTPEPEE